MRNNGVHINISSRHGHLGADSREKISLKLEKLSRYHDRVSAVTATIDLENEGHPQVEVCAAVDGAAPFVARASGSHLLGAVESVVQKLEEQLRRHKEKLIESHRSPVKREQVSQTSESLESADDLDEA